MRKRILAFFLTLCIVLTMLPVMAFAAEAEGESAVTKSFSELLGDAETTQIQLTQNEMVITTVNKSVEIDLNGYELSGTIMVADGNTITIKDSKVSGKLSATLIIDAGELLIKSVGSADVSLYDYVAKTSAVEVYSDYIKVTEVADDKIAYEANGELYYYLSDAIAAANGGAVTVRQNKTEEFVELYDDVTIAVAEGKSYSIGTLNLVMDTEVTFTSGILAIGSITGEGSVVLNGADIKMMSSAAPVVGTDATLTIFAGYYAFDANAFLAAGKKQVAGLVVESNDKAVAYIGTTGYETLEAAIAAANGGNTIVLVKDIDTLLNIAEGLNFAIELNGHYINGTILNYGTLVIKNELGAGTGSITKLINFGTATVAGGTYNSIENGDGATLAITGDAAINALTNTGVLKISGGKFAPAVAATLVWTDFVANNYLVPGATEYDFCTVAQAVAVVVVDGVAAYFTNVADVWATLVDGAVVYLYADADSFTVSANIEVVLCDGAAITNVTVAAGKTLTVPCGTEKYTYGAGVYATIVAPVAKIGDVYYMTLQDAVNAAADNTLTTIVLIGTGDLLVLDEAVAVKGKKNIVLDLNGLTVAFDDEAAYGFAVPSASTVKVVNGILATDVRTIGNLTLDGAMVTGKLFVQRGIVLLTNGATVYALDITYKTEYAGNYPVVTIDETAGGVVAGINFAADGADTANTMALIIKGGEFGGDFTTNEYAVVGNIAISGGDFYGIEDYENFYLYCRNGGTYPVATEDGYTVGTKNGSVVTVTYGSTDIGYLTIEEALAAIKANKYNVTSVIIKLNTAFTKGIEIADLDVDVVIDLNGKNLGGVTYDDAGNSLTIRNSKTSGVLSATSTVVNGKLILAKVSVQVKATETVVVLASENAALEISGATIKRCKEIAAVDGEFDLNLLITGGTFNVKPEYQYVATTHVVKASGNNWTVALANPVAAVIGEDGNHVERYATFADAVAAAVEGGYAAVEVLIKTSAAYEIDLPDGAVLAIINTAGADIVVVEDTDTFTRLVDEANGIYAGYFTYAIVNETVYCKDNAEVAAELAKGAAVILVPNNIDALTISGANTVELTVAKNVKIATLTITEGTVKFLDLIYSVGEYTDHAYGAKNGLVVYDSIQGAIDAGVASFTAVIDDAFVVAAGKQFTISDKVYGVGSYANLNDADAKIGDVFYATINDAIATLADGEVINVLVDSAFTVAAGAQVTLVAGETTTVYGAGSYDNLADADAKVGNVVYATVELAYTENTGNFTIVLVRDVEEIFLAGSTATITLNLNKKTVGSMTLDGTFVITKGTVSTLWARSSSITVPKDGSLTVEELVLDESTLTVISNAVVMIKNITVVNGASAIVLASAANFTLMGLVIEEGSSLEGSKFRTGNYYNVDLDLIKPYIPAGYALTKVLGETTYYAIVPVKNIVACVDEVLYSDITAAAIDALKGGFELEVLVEGLTITLTADLNKVVLADTSVAVTVVADTDAYYVAEADGVYTYEYKAAEIDGVYYNNIQAAIDVAAKEGGKVIVYNAEEKFVINEGSYVLVEYEGKAWMLAAGKYGFADAELFVAVAYSGSNSARVYYRDIKTAILANEGKKVTITLAADVDGLNVQVDGEFTIAVNGKTIANMAVSAGNVTFSGKGTIKALYVQGGVATLNSSALVVNALDVKAGALVVSAATLPEILEASDLITIKAVAYAETANGVVYNTGITSYKEGTIVLLADIAKAATISNNVTIDLNGYTLAGLTVKAGKEVTLIGEGKVGEIVNNGTLNIASTDIKFAQLLADAEAGVCYTFVDSEKFVMVYSVDAEDAYAYSFVAAGASFNGVGYETLYDAYNAYNFAAADFNIFKLYEDVTIEIGFAFFGRNVAIELNGYELAIDYMLVSESLLMINNGTVSATDETTLALILVRDGMLALDQVVITDTGSLYDTDTGVQVTVAVSKDSSIFAADSVINTIIVERDITLTIDFEDVSVSKLIKKSGATIICENHKLVDGKCVHCGEVAKKVTVPADVTVLDWDTLEVIEPTNGAYYFFKGDRIILKHGAITPGTSFNGWDLYTTADDHIQMGNAIEIGSADIVVEMILTANETVDVTINAPLFNVTGLSGIQLGAATVAPNAGSTITVTYAGAQFLADSAVVYWVNENGMIVGKGNELTYTVSTATTLTAICDQGAAESALVVFRNGADKVGSKVLSYVSATLADVANLELPANAVVGMLNVVGWKIAGTDEVLDTEAYHAAVEAAIANGTVLYLEPAIAKTTANVNIYDFANGELLTTVEVTVGEYAYISAPAVDGMVASTWLFSGEVAHGEVLVTIFFEDTDVYVIYADEDEVEADPTVRLETGFNSEAGQIYLNGIYSAPAGYTLTDAGIIYTTNESVDVVNMVIGTEGVKVKNVSGLNGNGNVTYNLTLNTSKDEVTVYAKAFMTFVDADNHIITIYTDVEAVYYNSTSPLK